MKRILGILLVALLTFVGCQVCTDIYFKLVFDAAALPLDHYQP